ncbi:MAG: ester cyclase [Phenylobacterium sp.]|uniref:ester cyclase n=1 Tax=Phenylobacterium sp. TaxID=1871053 RepID=UPI00273677AA|nr:ester cyclase [Phenylobacterium sp.]MDP3749619.1 ester cyclase [Phenylobacterium sp.]
MTREEMIEVMTQLMAAKRDHDIDRLIALYTPDCILEQPSLGVRSEGHANIRPGLELFAHHFPDYTRAFEGAAVDGDRLISWGTAQMTLTGDFKGHRPNGRRASVMTFVLFRFDGGRIAHEGHHWDLASICRQSGLPVEALAAP